MGADVVGLSISLHKRDLVAGERYECVAHPFL